MEINFLGSGSAWVYSEENFHSNILITINNKKLLFDCGSTIFEALKFQNINVSDIDSVFISHNHPDHLGGLPDYAFRTYFNKYPFGGNKKELIANKNIMTNLIKIVELQTLDDKSENINKFFNLLSVYDNDTFNFADTKIQTFITEHITGDNIVSNGIFIDKKVLITGDTSFNKEILMPLYEKAEIIFNDCTLKHYPNNPHCSYQDLCTLPINIKNKMWLYHYSGETPDCKKDGFLGFVKRGQKFNI